MNLSFRTLFGGALLLIGSVTLLIGGDQILTERRYADYGEDIEAVVLKKDLRPATSNSSTSYEITYRVTPRGGQPVDRTEPVAVATWENLQPGRSVRVQYIPGDPASARLEGTRDVIGAAIAAGVGLVLWCVGGVLLGISIHTRVRRARLLKEGRRAEATVTAVRSTNLTINNRRQWVVEFTYHDHVGQRHAGRTGHLAKSDATLWGSERRGT